MTLRKARVSLEYLHENVTNDTAELRKPSRMLKSKLYRNLKKITQYGTTERKPGSARPLALTPDDKRSVYQRALQNPLSSTAKKSRVFGSKGCSSVDAHCLSNFEEDRHFQEKSTYVLDSCPGKEPFLFCQTWLVDEFFVNVFIADESYFQLYRNKILHQSKGQKPVKPAPKFCLNINHSVGCSEQLWIVFVNL